MALSKPIFNAIKSHVAPHLAELKALTPIDQLNKIADITGEFYDTKYVSPEDLAGFVLLFNTQAGLIAKGSPEHHALRDALGIKPVITAWPFPNPPKSFAQLVSNWAEYYNKIGDAAALVDFASANAPEYLAAAIRQALGLGGLEDLGDGREINSTDPVMALFIKALSRQLLTAYPHWAPEGDLLTALPADVDGRAIEEINIADAAKKAEQRATKAKHERENKRQTELLEKRATRKELAEQLKGLPEYAALLNALQPMPFDELRDKAAGLIETFAASLQLNDSAGHLTQVIYATLTPAYFREAAEGDLAFRRVAPKPASTVRRDNATLTALAKLVGKYGFPNVSIAVAKVLADQPTLLKAAEAYKSDEDEAETVAVAPLVAAAAK